jgi:integrase
MAPKATGQVIRRGEAWFARVRTGKGPGERPAIKLPTCTTEKQAEARKDLMVALIAKLRTAGRGDFIPTALDKAATLPDERLAALGKLVDGLCAGTVRPKGEAALAGTMTLQTFAERWTSGELARLHPDHIRTKKSAGDDKGRLEKHVYPVIGHVALASFRLEDAEAVMRSLPPELSPASRRHVAGSLARLMRLAVYPCRILAVSPLPPGFLPSLRNRKTGSFLYPAEEAKLLACIDVPLHYRMLYGVLAREGMRRSEAANLLWQFLDLEQGTITLEHHKTAEHSGARTWALDASTAEALRRWRRLRPGGDDQRVFRTGRGGRVHVRNVADCLRSHLTLAKVDRDELHRGSERRMRMRVHDLRATFVTLALALDRSETWVTDRTGHTSSAMLQRYRRAARMAAELGLGWLAPMHETIPELARTSGTGPGTDAAGASAAPPKSKDKRADMRTGPDSGQCFPAGAEQPDSRGGQGRKADRSRPLATDGAHSEAPGARSPAPLSPRAEAVAHLASDIARATAAGDLALARCLSETLGRLLAPDGAEPGGVVDLAARREKKGGQS